jgi:NTP pyrophosphatase (non-canonical NTP hydrolase)
MTPITRSTEACEDAQHLASGTRASGAPPQAVVCGTFRREPESLRRDHIALLRAGCEILSPQGVDFVGESNGFVFAEGELGESPDAIEDRHLAAIERADFIWLHAPTGYVGPSAALELGVARALGTPVYCRELPNDIPMASMVVGVSSPGEAVSKAREDGPHTPALPLHVLQAYYHRIAGERGYSEESPQDSLLLLTEEVGELARAIRKSVGISRSMGYGSEDPATELADVQLYVLHLANVLEIDLATAVANKERLNATRFASWSETREVA